MYSTKKEWHARDENNSSGVRARHANRYEEELMRNLVDNQQAVRQARTAADAMQRLTITLWQGNRAREKLCDKTKRLVQNISSYSEKTRAVRNGETPAATGISGHNIRVG